MTSIRKAERLAAALFAAAVAVTFVNSCAPAPGSASAKLVVASARK